MDRLPTNITIDGTEYHLAETQISKHDASQPCWWWLRYRPYNGKTSPHVRIKDVWCYLTSFAATKEEANNDLSRKVNAITKTS